MTPAIRLGISIQHAPWSDRGPMLMELQQKLTEEYRLYQLGGGATLALTQYPIPVTEDRGTRRDPEGLWPVNRRAWLDAASWDHPTHLLVLQDDMMICRRFFERLAEAILYQPEEAAPLCLLCARKAGEDLMAETPYSYFGLPDGTWGGSTVLPVKTFREYLEWTDANVALSCPTDDQRMDLWLRTHERLAWATVPSLIQHLGEKSLCGRGAGRQSPYFADDFDALPSPLFSKHLVESLPVSRKSLHKSTFTHLKEQA